MNGTNSRLYVELLALQKELADSRTINVQAACKRILDICVSLPDIDCGGVYLADDTDSSHMALQAGINLSPAFTSMAISIDASSPVMPLLARSPLFVVDLLHPPDQYPAELTEELKREGMRLVVILPMRWNGRFIACINLAGRSCGTLSNQTMEAFQFISGYMAGCLAQLYEFRRAERSEHLYKTLFEQTPVGLISTDFSGVKAYLESLGLPRLDAGLLGDAEVNECIGKIVVKTFNSEAMQLFQSESGKLDGEFFIGRSNRESRDVVRRLLASLLNDRTQAEMEARMHGGGNNCQYLIIRYTVVPGYEFNWGAVLFSLLNITDLHETMQALQGSLLRNRGILNAIPDLMIVFDDRRHIEEFKPSADVEPMGRDITGKPVHALGLPPQEEQALNELLLNVDRAESMRYLTIHLPTVYGARTFDARFAPMGNGHVLMIARDITEAEEMQRRLREGEEQFRNLAEQSPNMIFINCRGRVVFANQECERVMGISRAEFYSKDFDFRTLAYSGSRALVERNFTRHMGGDDVEPYEYQLVRRDGTVLDAIITSKIVRYQGEEAIMGIITDITEHKRIEEKLRQTNEDLEQFVYVASHDLQEPLRGISSYMELLSEQYADVLDEKGNLFVNRSGLAARRLQGMIDGLLAFSRITRRELPDTVVDLDCLLDDVLATMRLPAEASLTRQPLPVVRGDAAQLESVLRNLLSNALKFCRNVPEIRVGCLRVDDAWEITVCDNGIGIAPAYLEEIFDIFRRLHTYDQYPGSGIGLANVKKIIERHGGTVRVQSTPGVGSVFCVRLPVITENTGENA